MKAFSDVDVLWFLGGFAVLLICAECLAYGITLYRLREHPWAPGSERETLWAEWIMLGTSFLLFVSASGLMVAGMVWMPLLLIFAAATGMIAFQKLDMRRFAEAKLFSMLGATLTLTVAAISFGRASIGNGMGPLHAVVVLLLGAASTYAVWLIARSQHRR